MRPASDPPAERAVDAGSPIAGGPGQVGLGETGPGAAAPRLRPPARPVERRTGWWWALQGLAFGAPFVAGTVLALVVWPDARVWIAPLVAVSVALLLTGVVVEPLWRLRVHRWEVTDEAVYALSGWWVREWRVAPISRIQTVDTVRGPVEQLLGLSTLRVTTASSRGAIEIVGLDHEVAADVAHRLTLVTQSVPGDAT